MPSGVYVGNKGRLAWNKGKKFSEESKKRMSASHKKTYETKTIWNKGKHIKCNNALEVWRLNGGVHPHLGKKRPEITGENNNMWKGGITPERNKIRSSPEYRIWKYAVFAKDNFTCQDCNKRGGNLNAHHVKRFAVHPELRFAIDNGVTLCTSCHNKFHKKHGKNYV
jgi:hypothetical protein